MFYASPLPTGDDWTTFYESGLRVISGQNLYVKPTSYAWYSNPPWLALILAPLTVLGKRISWSIISALSILAVLALVKKFNLGKLSALLLTLSPPFIYTLLHGQVDAIISLGLLLPIEWWGLVALTKPQTFGGLLLVSLKRRFTRSAMVLCGALLITSAIFGFWFVDLLQQPKPFVWDTHNIFLGLWPFQWIVALLLVLLGLRKKDDRYLLLASPFTMPYVTTGNLYGSWLALCMLLPGRDMVLILLVWWGAVVYRMLT